MPKVKTKSGKIKKFPYTKKGVAQAKQTAQMGGKMMMAPDEMAMMGRKKKTNTYGMTNLKKG